MDGVLQNLATNENSGQLLENLGSLFAGSEQNSKANSKKKTGGNYSIYLRSWLIIVKF